MLDGLLVYPLNESGAPFPMWLVSLPVAPSPTLLQLLSIEERQRADRFRTAALRQRYIAAHAGLRLLAARCFGGAAGAEQVVRDARGKLQLRCGVNAQCSISYAADQALIGISEGSAIGVDAENLRPIDDAAELMELHYTPAERAALRALTQAGKAIDHAFLAIWVRKEACVKALGKGLAIPLTEVEIGLQSRMTTVRIGKSGLRTAAIQAPGDLVIAWAQTL
ncbi:4'-phosphopantetheinyl transferase [Sphingomonas zeicaulis]|uniref:4'-phosphopantetheinyl transferase family protein n=1 Tax=Sphingomonas zeicaulis TaxID=1632740 RepID=UPI003D1A9E27